MTGEEERAALAEAFITYWEDLAGDTIGDLPETQETVAGYVTALMPAVDRIAAARSQQRAAEDRRLLADLVEAVGRGDEHGLPEAYRAALEALRAGSGTP